MKKLFVLFVSLNLVLFFNFSLWGSYGPLISFNQSFAQNEDGEDEDGPTFVNPHITGDAASNFPLRLPDEEVMGKPSDLFNCVASGPREFEQTAIFADAPVSDGQNKDVIFRNQSFDPSVKGIGGDFRIKHQQLENFRGYRQLFIDHAKSLEEAQQKQFQLGSVIAGVESPSGYIPYCPEDYSCMKVTSNLTDGNVNNLNFKVDQGAVTLGQAAPNALGLEFPPFEPGGDLVGYLGLLKCKKADDCASRICTRQSMKGLADNYGFSIGELEKLWVDGEEGLIDSENFYSKDKYCQPYRVCLRQPTTKNNILVHDDDYCQPGLEIVDQVCIDKNEFVLNNIETYPDAEVNDDTCKITWKERKIEDDSEVPSVNGDFCTIPGKMNLEDCETAEGSWNHVTVKYSQFSRFMLGLEWLWSQADMDNVVNELSIFPGDGGKDKILLGPDLHKLGVKLKELRTAITLDRIVKLDESITEALSNVTSQPENPENSENSENAENTEESKKESLDGGLQSIQLNFFKKMVANSYLESALWIEMYGKKGMEQREQAHLLDLALAYVPTENDENSITTLQVRNTGVSHDDWDKDSAGREYMAGDTDPDGGASDLTCKGQIEGKNDDPVDEIESCSMAEDSVICEFHISDRNCVQDTVYMITDDYFKSSEAHDASAWETETDIAGNVKKTTDAKVGGAHTNKSVYINRPMDEAEKEKYGRTRSYITNSLFKKNVHYETSCFYINKKEQELLNYDDASDDHYMEDDCSDDNTDHFEWGFSKNGNEDAAYRDRYASYTDEIDGITFGFNGHFARVPYWGTVSSYTQESAWYHNESNNVTSEDGNNGGGFKRSLTGDRLIGIKQQGGLVNPVMPKAILSEEPHNFQPSDDGEDGFYNVPRIGNWFIEEESVFRENIKRELGLYTSELNEQAKACGKNVKVNESILTMEEFLYLERKDNPSLSLRQAKRMASENYDARVEKTLDALSDQMYNLIMSLHFSLHSGEHGTFSLVSRTPTGPGEHCPDGDEGDNTIGYGLGIDNCRSGNSPDEGRPLGIGLDNINTILYWLALYKAEEALMFEELHNCMDKRRETLDSQMGTLGIGDESQLKQLAAENTGVVENAGLGSCLAKGDAETSGGGGSGGGPNVPGGGPPGSQGVGSAPGSSFFGLGLLSNTANGLGEGEKENKKPVTTNAQPDTSDDSSNSSANGSAVVDANEGGTGDSVDAGNGGATGNVNTDSPDSVSAKRAKNLRKRLIASAKKINAKNKELVELFKNSGVNPPPRINSSSAFQGVLGGGTPQLASLGSIPNKTQRQTLQKAKAANKSKKFTRRSSGRGGSVKRGRSGRSSRRVTRKQAKKNKKVLNYIKKNKGRYVTQDSDGIFGRITKAIIRNGYPIFLETVPSDLGNKKLPTQGRQNAVELSPEQKAARKEMELLKGLNKK